MFRQLSQTLVASAVGRSTPLSLTRSLAAASSASDPIQKLFVDKLREYKQKQGQAKNGLVDADAETLRHYQDVVERVERQFEAKGQDMTAFPKFDFKEPTLQAPGSGH